MFVAMDLPSFTLQKLLNAGMRSSVCAVSYQITRLPVATLESPSLTWSDLNIKLAVAGGSHPQGCIYKQGDASVVS
jgi:hypothetical protein